MRKELAIIPAVPRYLPSRLSWLTQDVLALVVLAILLGLIGWLLGLANLLVTVALCLWCIWFVKRSDTERQRVEERFAKAFDLSPLVKTITSLRTGRLVAVNEAFIRINGFTRAEALGRTTLELGLWADPEDRIEELASVARLGRISNREYHFRLRNGQELIGLLSAEVIEFGGEECALTVITDITERKQAEEALRESEERVRLATRAAEMGVWDKDLRTGRLQWDARCKELLGLPPDAATSPRVWLAALHPEDRKRVTQAIKQALAPESDGRLKIEYRVRPAYAKTMPERAESQTDHWLLANGQAYFDERGQPVRYSGVLLDTTARKQLEVEREHLLEQERAAREAALTALRAKDDFVAVISHELRGPLNAILGWARILKQGKYDDDALTHAIEVIERSACTQQRLIEDLLDAARFDHGQLRLSLRNITLAEVIAAAADVVRPSAEAKEVDIELQILSRETMTGDSDRLQQIVWNLLANSVKFTPRGGRITVRLERLDGHLQLTVSDTGLGLEPAALPHVFDRYWQAHRSSARRRGGLGLGLALVRQIVELHGGTVAAESAGAGQGATFIVNLPLRAAVQSGNTGALARPALPKADAAVANSAVPALDGLWALIVDDEPDARGLLAVLLQQYGVRVTAADSAAAALAALDEAAANGALPDILISDIGMPEEDGYQLIEQVRARPAASGGQLAAIALTAFGSAADRVRALAAGFHTHVVKPVEPVELALIVASLTNRTARGMNP